MRKASRFDVVAVAFSAALFLFVLVAACAHQASGQDTAARAPASESARPDGGLPLPPAAARRGVMVPSDLGFGAGPAGPSTNSGTPPATPPPSVPNGT
jgi:hypothetical protein